MFCPKCGNKLVEEAKFCNKCGTRLYDDTGSDQTMQEDLYADDFGDDLDYEGGGNGKGKYILIILLAVLILAIAAILFFMLKNGGGHGGPFGSPSTKKKEKSAEATTAEVAIQPVEEEVTEEEPAETTTEVTTEAPPEEPTEASTEEEKVRIADLYSKEADIKDGLKYNGHFYLIYNFHELGLDTFSECEDFCEERGGHLAVINSEEENFAIYSYLLDKDRDHTFFGFTDKYDEGIWEWVDGSPVTYTNWAKGQPNNKGGGEDYAQFNGKNGGTWNDARFGSESWRFLCEWDSEF